MDVDNIKTKLNSFIGKYRANFENMPKQESALLEMASLIVSVEHYRIQGYRTQPKNLQKGFFRVKTTARGYPTNFSYFVVQNGSLYFEIHANLGVYGWHGDGGVYVVDVGVVDVDLRSQENSNKYRVAQVENNHLVTFIETKKLVIFPMLLAHFFGIVHEIKPKFIKEGRPRYFVQQGHFSPSLLATGYLSHTSDKIVRGFGERGLKINIVENFDVFVAKSASKSNVMEETIFKL